MIFRHVVVYGISTGVGYELRVKQCILSDNDPERRCLGAG